MPILTKDSDFNHAEVSQIKILPLQMQHLRMKNYSYVALNLQSKEAIVVDPAWEIEKIEMALEDHILTGIILTHAHFDHVHLVAPLVKKYRCLVWMGSKEITHSGFYSPGLIPIEKSVPFQVAGMTIIPFLTPGHTPGSMCYLIENNIFTGDTLFSEGCGACFGTEGNPKQLYESLQYLKREVLDNTLVFPGHSFGVAPGQTFGSLLHSNIYLDIKNEDDFVAYRMRKGQKNLFNFCW